MHTLFLLGVAGDTLPPEARSILDSCGVVVAAERHQKLVDDDKAALVAISPLGLTMESIAHSLRLGNVAVLASGDPLFFGIGKMLLKKFGNEVVQVVPALSSIQLGFARFGVWWDDAVLLSIHGRKKDVLTLLLPHDKVGLLTDGIHSPDVICRILLDAFEAVGDERIAHSYQVMVAENIGCEEEKLTRGSLAEIASLDFSPLNVMILWRDKSFVPESPLGLMENNISHSRGLITKDEVRAATLHALQLPKAGVFWDVGAGSGSVSIEAARLCPGLQVFAIEKKPEEVSNIKDNIRRFHTYNVRVIEGQASAALESLPDPDRVFVGGSGGNLSDIIRCAAEKMADHGRIVVNGVIEKTVQTAPVILTENGFQVSVSKIRVTRCSWPETGESIEFNPITIMTGTKHQN